MGNLLRRSSIVLTPTAYDNGEILCAKPENGSGDFDFSRNSAATRVNAQGLVEDVQILSSNLVQNGDFSEIGSEEVSNGSFSQQGSELIVNGDFATDSNWLKEAGWTISGGTANCVNGQGVSIYQTNVVDIGKQYKLTFSISNYSQGFLGSIGNDFGGVVAEADGSYEIYGTATSGTFGFSAFGNFIGSIDNVSVVEVGQDWTFGTGWSIGDDKAVKSVSATDTNLSQSSVFTVGKTYKIVFNIESISGQIWVSGISDFIQHTTTGVKTIISKATNSNITFRSGSGSNVTITNISVKEVGQNWTFGTGWSVGDDKAISDGTINVGILQNNIFTSGKLYKISFDVDVTSGTLSSRIRFVGDGSATTISNITESGSYTFYQEADRHGLQYINLSDNTSTSSITNVSAIEITDDTNLPRINYEGFSYQDALGSELVTNGDFATNTWWTVGQFWSIANGFVTRAVVGSELNYSVSRSNLLTIGKSYKVEININSVDSGSVRVVLGSTNGTQYTSAGVYVFEGVCTSSTNFKISPSDDFNGSIDNVSVKEVTGQEVVPDSGCGSWLFEPQSTNLVPYSEDFSGWSIDSNVTLSLNSATSPDGTVSADNISYAGSVGSPTGKQIQLGIIIGGGTANKDFSYSVYIKGTGEFRLKNTHGGVVDTFSSNFTATSDWVRYDFSVSNSSSAGNGTQRLGILAASTDSAFNLDIWGTQLEEQSYATSYIPTDGTTVTRNQDACNNGGSVSTINSTEGVLYAEIAAFEGSDNTFAISLSDGSSNNRIFLSLRTPQSIYRTYSTGGADIDFTGLDVTSLSKVAVRYSLNNFSLWINGVKRGETLSYAGIPANTLNELSFDRNGAGELDFYGKTKAVVVWKEALTDAELALLTAPTPVDPTFTLDLDAIANQFTFSRASFGTIVNEQGLIETVSNIGPELVINGDFATDSNWGLGGGATISGGQANIIGDGSGYVSITQSSVFTAGKKYRVSVDVVINSGLGLKFQDGANNENIGFATSSGTYVFIFTAGSNTSFVVGRRTGGTAFNSSVDNVSVKEYIEDDIPRIDYSTGSEALLLEPQGTNLVSYSEDFSSLNIRNNAVVTSNAIISPSGLLDADEITFDGTGAGRVEASIPVTIGQTYTISLYLKNKDLSNVTQVWVGFSGGSQGQYVTITNEWQRYDITTDADGTTEYPRIQFSGTGSLYAWGFQTEQRSFATSYIPTSGTTVTRVGETCVNATPEINSEEGTLYAEISGFTSNAFSNNSISITGASNDNRLYIYRSNTDNKYGFAVFSGGSLQCNIKTDVVDFSVNAKIAVKYKLNDFALYLNGTQVATDSGGSTPIGLNSLQFNGGLGNSPFYGNTKDLQYFNKALGDYQLAQLTTI